MARYIFSAGTVASTGTRQRLVPYLSTTDETPETDICYVRGSTETGKGRQSIVTDDAGAYTAFVGPEGASTLYLERPNGTRVQVTSSTATTDSLPVAGGAIGGGGTAATLGTLSPVTGRLPSELYAARNGFYMQQTSTPAGASAIPYAASDSGVLSELAATLSNAEAGRTIRLYVVRLVSGSYQVVYDSGVIAAATAGTFTHTPPSSFSIQAGDLPAIWSSTSTVANGLRVSESGGNDIGHAKWAPSAAAPSVGWTVTGAVDTINVAGALRMTTTAASGSVSFDTAGGVPMLDGDARIKASARPMVDSFWAGKKILHVGTSIPAVAGSYAYQAVSMLEAVGDNQCVGSSGIVWNGTRALSLGASRAQLTGAGFNPNESYETRVIGHAADLYIFDHGFNDRTEAIGTIADTTAATFYGAYNVVLGALLAEKPKARIMMITPHTTWAPGTTYTAAIDDIRTAMLAIAQKYALPILDFTRTMQLGQTQALAYMADHTHPDSDWHNVAARVLYRFIRNL